MTFLFILTILVFEAIMVFVDWLIANAFYKVAETKGFYERKYFWYCFFLGPIGYLLVIALPDKHMRYAHFDTCKSSADPVSRVSKNERGNVPQPPLPTDSFEVFLEYALSYSSDAGMSSYLQVLSVKQEFSNYRSDLLRILNHTPSEQQRNATQVLLSQIRHGAI